MSQIKVTTIKRRVGGAPTFAEGLVSSGISTFSSNVTIGGTLSGDGSGLTNLPAGSGPSEDSVNAIAWFLSA